MVWVSLELWEIMRGDHLDSKSGEVSESARFGQGHSGRILVATLILLTFYFVAGYALRVPLAESKVAIRGDEHHYLTQAVSTIEDGDFVVLNNYVEGDYEEFYGSPLDPGYWNLIGARGYSGHSPGAGVIVAPGLWLANWPGVLATLALSMSVAFALTAQALRLWRGSDLSATELALLAAGFTAVPLLAYSHTLYPESFMAPLIAGMFLLAGVHAISSSHRSATVAALFAISLCGLSLGLHPKYSILLAGVSLYFVLIEVFGGLRRSRSARAISSMLYVAAAGTWALVFSGLHSAMWDTFSPFGWWTSAADEMGVAPATAIVQFLDLFFGRRLGVFVLVPLSILAVAFVIGSLWRRRTPIQLRLTLLLLITIVALAGPSAYSSDWHAGDSPLGRYASPLIPALLLTGILYATSAPQRRGQALFVGSLSSLGLLGTIVYTAFPSAFRPEPFGRGGSLDVLAEKSGLFVGLRDMVWSASQPSSWAPSTIAFGILVVATLWLFRRAGDATRHRQMETSVRPTDTYEIN